MADLVAIGYDDTTTALDAMEEVERLQTDLIIETDAVAAIIRTEDGKLRTITNQSVVDEGSVIAETGIDQAFQEQVREMLRPGTSALFLVVERVTDKALASLSRFGGRTRKTSLSEDVARRIGEELHGKKPGGHPRIA